MSAAAETLFMDQDQGIDEDASRPIRIEYIAEPTMAKFHASTKFVRGIMGPIGSGKSVGCLQECIRIGIAQNKQADGIRRSRIAFIRNTYPELTTTTLATFKDWYGDISDIKYGSPITAHVKFDDVDIEILFLALDKEADVKKLKSLELTVAWLNEASEIPKSIFEMATGRVGRYPAKRDGSPVQSCIIMDTNPPDDDSWWYNLFEEDCPASYELFKQPPAMVMLKDKDKNAVYLPNPTAENVKHQPLGYTYWKRQIAGKKPEWIKVYVRGQYGTSSDGRPCYPFYNDAYHLAEHPIKPHEGIPLLLGWDYGRTPACIVGQVSPRGQLMIIDEIVVEHDGMGMGVRKFTGEIVSPYLKKKYPEFELISWGDPSGVAKAQSSEESCFTVQADEGIPTQAASTNEISVRLGNVEYFLERTFDGEPGFLLSPACRILRKGFLGGYQFQRVQLAGDARFKDQPNKNRYSHPHDGLQYLADLARNGVVKATGRTVAKPIEKGISARAWT